MSIKKLFNIEGKVAIITGSSKGIGEAIARGLAEHGAKVVISSRKQEAVDAVVEKFKADGLDAIGIACHVGKAEQRKNLIDQVTEQCGGVDILVNNAATNPVFCGVEQVNEEAFDKIMGVNVKAPWALSNLVMPSMEKRKGGAIINISSVEGLKPSMGLGVYSTSKAALIMLTQNQAKEWGKYNIRSNALCPGLIKTKFSSAIWQNEGTLKHVEQMIPSGRMGTPEEMAGLAVLLASDAGAYMTGGVYMADGGFMVGG